MLFRSFTSTLFTEFTRRIGSSLAVGSAYHKNTNSKVERVNGVLGDTLRAFANSRKDDWDTWLPYAEFAINNAASTLGGVLTPFFIDRGQHPRMPLALPDLRASGESPAAYAARMKALEHEVRALLHAAGGETDQPSGADYADPDGDGKCRRDASSARGRYPTAPLPNALAERQLEDRHIDARSG